MSTPTFPIRDASGVTPAEKAIAAAASRPALTIDRHRLRDLFLPAVRRQQHAHDVLLQLATKSASQHREAEHAALCTAICAVEDKRDACIERVRERGGLLHIGAPGALA